jgi:hypothetical protein
MPDMTPRRLRLWIEPGQLAQLDGNALDEARRRLRQLRDDVELAGIDQGTTDSIDVILLVSASFRSDDIGEIATILRAALRIGPGPQALIGDDTREVRGIGGEGRTCPRCHGSDGAHVPGCPNGQR